MVYKDLGAWWEEGGKYLEREINGDTDQPTN